MDTVRFRDNSNAVVTLRKKLSILGCDTLSDYEETIADEKLMYYLGTFQLNTGLKVDFIAGKKTWAMIENRIESLSIIDVPYSQKSNTVAKLDYDNKISFAQIGLMNDKYFVNTNASFTEMYGSLSNVELEKLELGTGQQMRLAWDKDVIIRSIWMNLTVIPHFRSAWRDICSIYSESERRDYGIDLFAGCYNKRLMRGSNKWSSHAWGVAIDINSEGNKYRSIYFNTDLYNKPLFAFCDIMYNHGFRTLRHDMMHWQYIPLRFR